MASPTQYLIVGLGNLPYPGTRHSVGHFVLDSLASLCGMRLQSDRRLKGSIATKSDVKFGDVSITLSLYKPDALMNISGPPIAEALRHTARAASNLIVIHDSLDHKPASCSPKFGGSANGHNGIKSIIAALGVEAGFHRLRIGIGRGPGDTAAYVLDRLPSYEKQFWRPGGEGIDLVWREISKIINK